MCRPFVVRTRQILCPNECTRYPVWSHIPGRLLRLPYGRVGRLTPRTHSSTLSSQRRQASTCVSGIIPVKLDQFAPERNDFGRVLPHMCEQHTEAGRGPGKASSPTANSQLCQVAAIHAARSSARRIDGHTDGHHPRHCTVFLGVRVDEARVRPLFYHGIPGVATTRVSRAYL